MDEDIIIMQSEEVAPEEANTEDINNNVESEQFVEVIDLVIPEEMEITMEESIGGNSVDNAINHNSLANRNIYGAHNIVAIDGLQEALDKLGETGIVYSSSGGFAEFRPWADPSITYNRVGYFVSIIDEAGQIDICSETHPDVYGVTVDRSGFCGLQSEEYNKINPNKAGKNNWAYGKVCILGNVQVRTKDKLNVGDYVLPDIDGTAKKSESGVGFRVTGTNSKTPYDKSGNPETMANYVTIALVPQNDNVARIIKELNGIKGSVGDISIDIGGIKDELDTIKVNVGDKFEGIDDFIEDLKGSPSSIIPEILDIKEKAETAESNAQEALNRAETMKTQALSDAKKALDAANGVLKDLDSLKVDLEPLANYEDGDKKGVAGFVAKADADHTELSNVVTTVNEHSTDITAIRQLHNENGAKIQNLIVHSDRYSVGPLSITYGLSVDEMNGLLGEVTHYYVPIVNHTEKSYIYICTSNNDILKDSKGYFEFGGVKYGFTSPTLINKNSKITFNSKTGVFIVDDATVEITEISEAIGTPLELNSEYTFEFEAFNEDGYAKSYVWTPNDKWKFHSYISLNTEDEPSAIYQEDDSWREEIQENDLWYVQTGFGKYQSQTLYRYDGSQWVAVATLGGNARSIGLVQQTAKELTSTYADLKGNVSNIKQSVDEISTTVMNVDGRGSSIQQVADQIIMGTFDPRNSTSLGLLLNGLSSVSSTDSRIHTSTQNLNLPADTIMYSTEPEWDEEAKKFVFDIAKEDMENGKYCYYYNSEGEIDEKRYCKKVYGGYEVYTIGNIALASFNTLTTEERASIESWAKFKKGTDETAALLSLNADGEGADIASAVFGDYREVISIAKDVPDLTDITRYAKPPEYVNGHFTFEGMSPTSNGDYYMGSDSTCYHKLVRSSDDIIGYETYKMKTSNYASIMQKINSDGSIVGLVANNNDVDGSIFVESINGSSSALIKADKIGINGTAVFSDSLIDGKTTISGNNIRTGVITSNNYSGPVTYRMYGAKLDTENLKIVTSDRLSDCIYYAPADVGTLSTTNYYYAVNIKADENLLTSKPTGSSYIVSAEDFDLIPSDVEIQGTKFDLNVGTIYSKNFSLDRDGDLTIAGRITATSGYIGNDVNGFTIDQHSATRTYTVGADGLTSGSYYFKHNGRYYQFTIEENLTEGDSIIMTFQNGVGTVNGATVEGSEKEPYYAIYLQSELTNNSGVYYLSNGQISLRGAGNGNEGVYISPLGIGLGNGNFYVDNSGNVSMSGDITMDGNITMGGSIVLGGSITWDSKSNPVCVLYAKTALSAPTETWVDSDGNYNYGASATADVWHRVYQAEEDVSKNLQPDYYASYSYNGGSDWTEAVEIRGSDATVTSQNVFNALTNGGDAQGLFSVFNGSTNELFINATYIKSGVLSGITVESINDDGDTIRMENGIISLTPEAFKKPKMQIGFSSNSDADPYITFGQGTTDTTTTIDGVPVSTGTALLHKSSTGFDIAFYGSDGETNGIWFYDSGDVYQNSCISFGSSRVDFDHATVTGLNITFG